MTRERFSDFSGMTHNLWSHPGSWALWCDCLRWDSGKPRFKEDGCILTTNQYQQIGAESPKKAGCAELAANWENVFPVGWSGSFIDHPPIDIQVSKPSEFACFNLVRWIEDTDLGLLNFEDIGTTLNEDGSIHWKQKQSWESDGCSNCTKCSPNKSHHRL
jgi:hypothetical protein